MDKSAVTVDWILVKREKETTFVVFKMIFQYVFQAHSFDFVFCFCMSMFMCGEGAVHEQTCMN